MTPSDLRFLGELLALSVGTANVADHWAWDEFPESNGRFARDLARQSGRLATPAYFVPPLAGAWLAGKLTDHPGLSRSALRITASVAVASAVSGVIKYSVGRPRPFQSPDDGDDIRPFSGQSSFPSGHTTAAFALAAALDGETHARWVPWVAYPVAGLVGWSRIRDSRHWMSDVIGGALLGVNVSHRVLRITGYRDPDRESVDFAVGSVAGGPAAGVTARF